MQVWDHDTDTSYVSYNVFISNFVLDYELKTEK